MRKLRTKLLSAPMLVLACGTMTSWAAGESTEEAACARLLPAIESLRAMLTQEAKTRTTENETQRMQVAMTLLGLRYHSIESLESGLRSYESEEEDFQAALARSQAQLEAFEENARDSATPTPDPERKAQRAELDAVLKGLEQRVKALRERKASDQGRLAIERHDVEKLEALVRAWLEKTP